MQSRKRNRLPEYNYSTAGYYFITTCIEHFQNVLGYMERNKIILNDLGIIVQNSWIMLENMYDYISCDEYIVMPNHFHGIDPSDVKKNVGTGRDLSLKVKNKPLSEIIGVFKTHSSKLIHQSGNKDFKWQRSFYDRVIRNEKELLNIRKYIRQNPLKWEMEHNDYNNLDLLS